MKEKEIKIGGCIIVPAEVSRDAVIDAFLDWIESNGWSFGGGFQELSSEESGYPKADIDREERSLC